METTEEEEVKSFTSRVFWGFGSRNHTSTFSNVIFHCSGFLQVCPAILTVQYYIGYQSKEYKYIYSPDRYFTLGFNATLYMYLATVQTTVIKYCT